MKAKKNENRVEELSNICTAFEKADETFLGMFSNGEEHGGVFFCGEPHRLAEGFANILEDGFSDNATKEDFALANSIVAAIFLVLANGETRASIKLAEKLAEAIEEAKVQKLHNLACDVDEEDDDDEEEEDCVSPLDGECEDCEELAECLNKVLKDKGLYVAKKMNKK